jgi:hypothetical protein
MAVTRINNNQITDASAGNVYLGINANTKIQNFSITAQKIANNLTYGSDLTVTGNLTVNGQSTAIDTTITTIEDPVIVLASTQTGSPTVDIGFIGERGTSNNIAFVWDESSSEFVTAFTDTSETSTTINIIGYADIHTRDANIGGNAVINGTTSLVGNLVGAVNATANITGGNLLTAGLISATSNVIGGNILTGGLISATSTITSAANITGGNIRTGGDVSATGNITGGNIISGNAVIGNINVSGDITVNSLTSNTYVSASGNVIGGNVTTGGLISATGTITSSATITGGNLATGGTVSATSNITGGNILTGGIVSATATITGGNIATGGTVSATANITGGNILAGSGIISTSGNVTGGNLISNTVTNATGITVSTNSGNINLEPAGNVVINNTYINGLQLTPIQDADAASKYYVDTIATTGITIHEAVFAATISNLNTATGGTVTYAQPNGVANGVGATLTTTGTYTLIDTANVQTVGTRILVKDQANAVQNGVYVYSNATVITRSTDTDQYGADSAESFSINDYFFTTSGNVNAGTAFVVSAPPGVITFGTSNISFGVFSQSQVYSANTAAGLSLIGTVFSAKVDGITTAFDGLGNISVPPNAVFTTPNIGAATGTSLSTTGTVTGGNIATGGTVSATATITGGNLATGGTVSATGAITSTANITGGNILSGGLGSFTGNVIAANFVGNVSGNISAPGANTQVEFNDNGITNATSGFTFNKTSNLVTVGGNVDASNFNGNVFGTSVSASGTVTAASTVGGVITGSSASVTGTVTAASTVGGVITGSTASLTGNVTSANLVLTNGIIDGPAAGRITINGSDIDTDFAVDGDTLANVFYVDAGTGTASFGTSTQTVNAIVAFNATTSILAPVGNTAQRPATGVTGMLRFNTTNNAVEVYDNTEWTSVGVPVFTVIADEQFNGDGLTVAFTLGSTQTTNSCIVSINGVVQIPTLAYAVAGTDPTCVLTFTEAPATGDIIDVRQITTTTSVTSIANSSGNAVISTSEVAANVDVTGNLVISGSVSAAGFIGLDATKIANGTSEMSVVSSGGNIRANIGGTTVQTISPGLVAITGDLSVSGNATLSGNILGDRIQNGTTQIDIQTPNGNANITVGGTSNVAVFSTGGASITGNLSATSNVIVGSAGNAQLYMFGANIHLDNNNNAGNIAFRANVAGLGPGATLRVLGTGGIGVNGGIFNESANGVSNIGSATATFNTIFARATSAQYADLAEKYTADAEYAAGTVVSFGGSAEVTRTVADADSRVAGVISTNPSYIMNGGLEGEHVATVALTGRVPTSVTGTVRKGDLMVSAGNGVARAEADPRVGTVIGKALEDSEGDATIEVVVGRF